MKKSILIISVLLTAAFVFAGCMDKNANTKRNSSVIKNDEPVGLEELTELEELDELEFLEELEELEKLIDELDDMDE